MTRTGMLAAAYAEVLSALPADSTINIGGPYGGNYHALICTPTHFHSPLDAPLLDAWRGVARTPDDALAAAEQAWISKVATVDIAGSAA